MDQIQYNLWGYLHTVAGNEARIFCALPCLQSRADDGVFFLPPNDQWKPEQLQQVTLSTAQQAASSLELNPPPLIGPGQLVAIMGNTAAERMKRVFADVPNLSRGSTKNFWSLEHWTLVTSTGFYVRTCSQREFQQQSDRLFQRLKVRFENQCLSQKSGHGSGIPKAPLLTDIVELLYRLDLSHGFMEQQTYYLYYLSLQVKENTLDNHKYERVKRMMKRGGNGQIEDSVTLLQNRLDAGKDRYQRSSSLAGPVSQLGPMNEPLTIESDSRTAA